ncbi:hypothetical protein ES695_02975, partial [Candidatus Atribacteria bacterium 1244-E10-H5-B2]
MPVNDRPKIKGIVIIPFDKKFRLLIDVMKAESKKIGIRLTLPEEITRPMPIAELVLSEIARCDLVIAEVSQLNPNVFYEIGLAHALGKPVLFIRQEGIDKVPFDLRRYIYITYTMTPKGLLEFQHRFRMFLKDFIHAPRRFQSYLPFPTRITRAPFIVDLEKLNPREFENLCFELLTQMGFRRITWGKEFREIDAVATLSKKDPDGYEYHELWLISMGHYAPVETMLEMVTHDPEYFINRILRHPGAIEEISVKFRLDAPVTLLLISRKEKAPHIEILEHELRRMERRLKEHRYPFTLRVRLWDQHYLTNLIQQYPQVGYKYFSDEARAKSKYRKTPEELYLENVKLTEKFQAALGQLEEEKKKRFIAERDAAWKDVAFKAAHKLGNPIDAVETYLQSLKKRIEDRRKQEGLQIINDMEISIEEAKSVITQFKSLTRAEEINPCAVELLPLIEHACQIAKENGARVEVDIVENCPLVMVDPDRISECFNELVANATHWFDKKQKIIRVSANKVPKRKLPDKIDITKKYLKIQFADNGAGVPLANKETITP